MLNLTTKVPENVSNRLEAFDLELQGLRTGQEELENSVNSFMLETRVNIQRIEELKVESRSDLEPRLLQVEERQQQLLTKADEIQTVNIFSSLSIKSHFAFSLCKSLQIWMR